MDVLEVYYRENYNTLIKRLNSRLGSMQDAEDVVQEAFYNAFKYHKSCVIDLDRWFNVILTNTRKKFESERRLGGLTKNIDDCLHELDPIISDHIGTLTKEEIKKLVLNTVGEYGEVLRLNLIFGYSPREIAIITNVKNQTIRNYLRKFTNELKELYV